MSSPTHISHSSVTVIPSENDKHESEAVQEILQEQGQVPLPVSNKEGEKEAGEETSENGGENGEDKSEKSGEEKRAHEDSRKERKEQVNTTAAAVMLEQQASDQGMSVTKENVAEENMATGTADTDISEESIVVKEPEYFTMPPKRPRPPQKTREERGLPPLPKEHEQVTGHNSPEQDTEPHASFPFDAEDTGHDMGSDSNKDGRESHNANDTKINKHAETSTTHTANTHDEAPKGMTLMEHLHELRVRLVRSFIAVGLAFVLTYSFAEQLFAELCKPLIAALPEGSKLIFTALPEAFFVYLQVGLVAAIFLASPFLFYQVWAFIAPGLYDEEKKYMLPIASVSAIFFLTGASFCFFIVFPYAFTFFVGFASEDIAAMPSLSEYLGFSLKLLIAFGLIFEMPLFTFFLARLGIVTAARMRSVRRYAVLCIFIVAAILTPPDVISQLLMALPMLLLYELSIGIAVIFGKKKHKVSEDADIAEDADRHEKGGQHSDATEKESTTHHEGHDDNKAQDSAVKAEQKESI